MTPPAIPRVLRPPVPPRARRGDLALIATEHRLGADEAAPRIQVDLAVITGASPDGRIIRLQWARYCAGRGPSIAVRQLRGVAGGLLLPAALIDVDGAIAAAREHRWDSGNEFAPFNSLGQAVRLLAAHLRPPAAPDAPLIARARLHAAPVKAVNAA